MRKIMDRPLLRTLSIGLAAVIMIAGSSIAVVAQQRSSADAERIKRKQAELEALVERIELGEIRASPPPTGRAAGRSGRSGRAADGSAVEVAQPLPPSPLKLASPPIGLALPPAPAIVVAPTEKSGLDRLRDNQRALRDQKLGDIIITQP